MLNMKKVWMSALVLTTALMVGAPASAATPDKLIPANAGMVFHLNIGKLMESSLVKKYALGQIKSALENNAQIGIALDALKFDPMKDLTGITLAMSIGDDPTAPEMLVIGHGKFDVKRFETVLGQADELSSSDYSGKKVFVIDAPQQTMYASFVTGSAFVASNDEAKVKAAIDQAAGKKDGKIKKELAEIIAKADGNATAWGAGLIPEMVKEFAAANPQGEIIEEIKGITLSVTAAEGVKAALAFHVSSKDTAEEFKLQLEQLIQLAGAFALQSEEFGDLIMDVVNDIKVTAEGSSVVLNAELKAKQIEKLISQFGG